MHAIPTVYGGVQFRSRLEARYAAWFQIQKDRDIFAKPDEDGRPYPSDWRSNWRYEPVDFPGWIPDFLVNYAGLEILVEVKPALSVAELWPHTTKIDAALGDWLHEHHESDDLHTEPQRQVYLTGIDPSIALRRQCCGGVWEVINRPPGDPEWIEAGNRVQWKAPR